MKTSAIIVLEEVLKHLPGKHNQQLHAGETDARAARKAEILAGIQDMGYARDMASVASRPPRQPTAAESKQAATRARYADALDLLELQIRRMPFLVNRSIKYIGNGMFEARVDEEHLLNASAENQPDAETSIKDKLEEFKNTEPENFSTVGDVANVIRNRFLNSAGLGLRRAGTDGLARDEVTVLPERNLSPEEFERAGGSGETATGAKFMTISFPAAYVKKLTDRLADPVENAKLQDSLFVPEYDSIPYSERLAETARINRENPLPTARQLATAKRKVWTDAARARFGK